MTDSITWHRIAKIYAMVLAAAGIAVASGVLLFESFRPSPVVKPSIVSPQFPANLIDETNFDIRQLEVGKSVCYLYWYVSKERHVWIYPTHLAKFSPAEDCKSAFHGRWGIVTRVSESYWRIRVKNRKLDTTYRDSDENERDGGEILANEVVIE